MSDPLGELRARLREIEEENARLRGIIVDAGSPASADEGRRTYASRPDPIREHVAQFGVIDEDEGTVTLHGRDPGDEDDDHAHCIGCGTVMDPDRDGPKLAPVCVHCREKRSKRFGEGRCIGCGCPLPAGALMSCSSCDQEGRS